MTIEEQKIFRLKAIKAGYSLQEINAYLSSGDSLEDRRKAQEAQKKTIAPVQQTQPKPERNFLQKTAGFLGVEKFGQGIASAIRVAQGSGDVVPRTGGVKKSGLLSGGDINQTGNEESQAMLQQAEILKRTAPGSEERRRLLSQFNKIYQGGISTQAQIDPGTALSNREVIGSAGNVALNVATPSAFKGSLGAQVAKNATLGAGYGLAGGLNDNKQGKELVGSTLVGAGIGAVIPLASRGASKVANKVLPGIANKLEQTSLRLTPVQKTNIGKNRVKEVAEYLVNNKVTGSPEQRLEKVTHIYNGKEQKLQKALEALDVGYDKNALISKLQALKKSPQYLDSRDYNVIQRQIDEMIGLVENNYDEVIPFTRLNKLKRSTYGSAYNKAGDKVLDDVEHDIGDILRESIEEGTKTLRVDGQDINAFNREYGLLIQARKLLKTAEGRNQIGLVGKLVAAGAGGLIGNAVTPVVGGVIGGVAGNTLAETVAGTAVRSRIGQVANKASKGLLKAGKSKSGQIIKKTVNKTILNAN